MSSSVERRGNVPQPTYSQTFAVHLASRLCGADTLVQRLQSAAGFDDPPHDIKSPARSPRRDGVSPSKRRGRSGMGRKSREECQSFRLYWRSPLLVQMDPLTAVPTSPQESSSGSQVLFVDATFDFVVTSASEDAQLPLIQVRFGAMTHQNSSIDQCATTTTDGDGIGCGRYIQSQPLTMSDLRAHSEQVGIDLDGTDAKAAATLMAAALQGKEGTDFVMSSSCNATLRAESAHQDGERATTVRLVLRYSDLDEEGEMFIRDSNGMGGNVDGAALFMLVANLYEQDQHQQRHENGGDAKSAERKKAVKKESRDDRALLHSLDTWWNGAAKSRRENPRSSVGSSDAAEKKKSTPSSPSLGVNDSGDKSPNPLGEEASKARSGWLKMSLSEGMSCSDQKKMISDDQCLPRRDVQPLDICQTGATHPRLEGIGERQPESDLGYKIFCDLDGVLVDFDAGVKKLCNGRGPDELNPGAMWSVISRADAFYANLPWTQDGQRLWDAIKDKNPTILTGVPKTKKAIKDKAAWCERELGVDVNHVDMAGRNSAHKIVTGGIVGGVVNVITCWSKNKHLESGERALLIDDRSSLAQKWEEQGGLFIHHTDAETTLRQLKAHGVLSRTLEKHKNKATVPAKPAPPCSNTKSAVSCITQGASRQQTDQTQTSSSSGAVANPYKKQVHAKEDVDTNDDSKGTKSVPPRAVTSVDQTGRKRKVVHGHVLVGGSRMSQRKKKRGKVTIGKM